MKKIICTEEGKILIEKKKVIKKIKKESNFSTFKSIIVMLFITVASFLIGWNVALMKMQSEAVNNGFATYEDAGVFKIFKWFTVEQVTKFVNQEAIE